MTEALAAFQNLLRPAALPSAVTADPTALIEAFDAEEAFDPEVAVTVLNVPGLAAPVVRVRGNGALAREIEILPLEAPVAAPHWSEDAIAASLANSSAVGVRLAIGGRAELDGAIRIVHLCPAEAPTVVLRTRIEIGAESNVKIVEEIVSLERAHVAASDGRVVGWACEVVAGAQAKVLHSWANELPRSASFAGRGYLALQANSEVTTVAALAGGRATQVRWLTECQAPGANARFYGAARGRDDQRIDLDMLTIHQAPRAESALEYVTVMDDRAKGVFNGLIRIPPHAAHTEATQRNRNVLLSSRATVQTVPTLEIETDDVKCAHGASVSPVSAEQLYYMRARGISETEAKQMIIAGTTEPTVLRFATELAQARVRKELA